jgi:hypothetical protein
MEIGHFYFLDNSYFRDFPDPHLEGNKDELNGELHGRPCFFSYLDKSSQIYWMIPISSKIDKYKKIYLEKINRTGRCDTLVFGYVLGHEKAFLIQNMCPVIPKYINCEYINRETNVSVRVDGILERDLYQKSSRILALAKIGKKVIFPDVLKIEKELKQISGI